MSGLKKRNWIENDSIEQISERNQARYAWKRGRMRQACTNSRQANCHDQNRCSIQFFEWISILHDSYLQMQTTEFIIYCNIHSYFY
jgi:hypothetical protein